MKKKNSKLLIIGGDSYIARSFIKYHINQYDISLISRQRTGFTNETIVSDLWKIPHSEFRNTDIVFNCIGIAHRKSKIKKEEYLQVNYQLAVFFANMALKHKVGIFLQMSTIAVYGRQKSINYRTQEKPINDYGLSKYMADQSLLKLNSEKFRVILLRPPMIYGKGAPGNMLRLIGLVHKNIPLPFKDIENKRDFLHAGNLVQCIEYVICTQYIGVLLLSEKNPVSASQLIYFIYKSLGMKPRLFKIPDSIIRLLKSIKPNTFEKLYDTLEIDISESMKFLPENYPTYTLESGIEEMAKWYLDNKSK